MIQVSAACRPILDAMRGTLAVCVLLGLGISALSYGQSGGSSGTARGSVLDQSGAVIVGAAVQIQNPVSHYVRTVLSDSQGKFQFDNIPYNNYHVTAVSPKFRPSEQDVDVRTPIPIDLKFSMVIGASTTTVEVRADAKDLIEVEPMSHTDVDRGLFDTLPLESQSSSLSSLVTLSVPGIAADSNGLFHGMGDHAENSFSVDGQKITDQQSKVFSNQIPMDSVQSMEVIQGSAVLLRPAAGSTWRLAERPSGILFP
jgi:hypothetical protein